MRSPTFYRIYKSKSTEGFQSVPYVVALFSAMLWIFYALIKSNEALLITINAAGVVIESIYVVMYFVYADKKTKWFTAKIMLGLNVGFFGLILLVTLLFFKGDKRVVTLGWICVGFSVSVFVAPLSIILVLMAKRVIQTRSVEYMPFSLSLSLTLSAVVWFLYGLLIKDKYVALPNVLGFTFGVVQMILYVVYMNKTPVAIANVKDAAVNNKVPTAAADDHVVVNIAKLSPALPEKSSEVHPVFEMGAPRCCATEAGMGPNGRDVVDVFVSRHSPAVGVA
ncbi:hypothetical protein HU200_058205 [Digitaria exilis]|uniref:Bidirectional sugar transporter SWEET n=1 Tax=Digitaria exilis TaxID=1010633 RepID=A0A835AIF2_9POAL|nr:hypothetical protein HU200_058205 [Digitaria exilis]